MRFIFIIKFYFWLKWWFGCWGWAEAEENKDEEQKDRKENNIPLKKIALMKKENLKFSNDLEVIICLMPNGLINGIQKPEAMDERRYEFDKELFPPKDEDEADILELVKNNKLVELFKSEGPEAVGSKSENGDYKN